MGTVLKACDIFVTTIYRLKAVRGKGEKREERQEKRFQQKRPHEGNADQLSTDRHPFRLVGY
ncbi:MAG: hypothetical protein K6L60_10535, partial [Oceanobacter sp.]